MARIYALMAEQLVLYVGQTKRDLRKRELEHRHWSNATTSRYIPDYIDWTIHLLEECDDIYSTQRERYYYDTLKPLYNRYRPGQPQIESLIESRRRAIHKWRSANKDAYKEYQRQYQRQYRLKKKADHTTPV